MGSADWRDTDLELPQIRVLRELENVMRSPLPRIGQALSTHLGELVPHRALVIFTDDCTGMPRKTAGAAEIIDRATLAELDAIRGTMPSEGFLAGTRFLAGTEHPVMAWTSRTGALLVLVVSDDSAPTLSRASTDDVAARWQLVALGIHHQVTAASPDYLRESRAGSVARALTLAEVGGEIEAVLVSLLSALRSPRMSGDAARRKAIELAAAALVRHRSATDRERAIASESVAGAFKRLRDDLASLVRYADLTVQFVEPPLDGRALPGEVAHAGRAIVRDTVLAVIEQPTVSRIRIQWDCDGKNLLIRVRDDGPGHLDAASHAVRVLGVRVAALNGELAVRTTPEWGSEIEIALPLDEPRVGASAVHDWQLTQRERDVLVELAAGERNGTIGKKLCISENTVKFHVANLLRKSGASTRAELAGLARAVGV